MSAILSNNLNANNKKIENVPDPQNPQDAVNLRTLTDAINNIIVNPITQSYTHEQNIPSTHWLVNHNLGFNPNVRVTNSAGDFVLTEIQSIDLNNLYVIFDGANSGIAYCS